MLWGYFCEYNFQGFKLFAFLGTRISENVNGFLKTRKTIFWPEKFQILGRKRANVNKIISFAT